MAQRCRIRRYPITEHLEILTILSSQPSLSPEFCLQDASPKGLGWKPACPMQSHAHSSHLASKSPDLVLPARFPEARPPALWKDHVEAMTAKLDPHRTSLFSSMGK